MQIPTRPSHVDPRANCTAMHSEPVHWRESSSLGKLTHGGFLPRLELKPKAGISPVGKTPAPWGRHQGGAGRRPPTGSVSGSFGPAENFSKLFRVVLMAFSTLIAHAHAKIVTRALHAQLGRLRRVACQTIGHWQCTGALLVREGPMPKISHAKTVRFFPVCGCARGARSKLSRPKTQEARAGKKHPGCFQGPEFQSVAFASVFLSL